MAMLSQEEHALRQRRRFRQLLGLAVCIFVLVGVLTVLSGGVRLVRALFDNSALKEELTTRLQCYVMLDPLPFDKVEDADANQIQEYAIWSTVNQALATQGNLDTYERDPDTDGIILPTLEVDAAIAALVGPEYPVQHATFENSDMTFLYLEDQQGYLIPVTGQVGQYTPQIEKMDRSQGLLYVTVGYVPTFTSNTFVFSAATEPTKYMDYVFERSGGNWYLTALQESETRPAEANSNSAAANDQNTADLDYDPAAALQESMNSEAAGEGPTGAAAEEAQSREEGEADSAAAEDEEDADSEPQG